MRIYIYDEDIVLICGTHYNRLLINRLVRYLQYLQYCKYYPAPPTDRELGPLIFVTVLHDRMNRTYS
jgi:hypothetical protein